MAGVKRGSIEHVISNINDNSLRDMFAATVRFFDAHPQMTRIASQGGGAGATGTASLRLPGFTSDVNHSGENAFGVWRWNKVNGSKLYILMQWCYNSTFNTSPGNPGVNNTSSGIGFAFALDTGGGNPWAGGIANVGADVKGSTVWTSPGGTLCVWPRANSIGGSGATNKQYLAGPTYGSVTGTRLHMITDDDSLWWWVDLTGDGTTNHLTYIGPYIPHEEITLLDPNAALVHFAVDPTALSLTNPIGSLIGTSSSSEGGAVVQALDGSRIFKIGVVGGLNSAIQMPNSYTGGYDDHDIFLRMEDATSPARNGLFGKLDPSLTSIVCNLANGATNADLTRIVAGSGTALDYKFLLPWNGVTTPGSGASNLGIQF